MRKPGGKAVLKMAGSYDQALAEIICRGEHETYILLEEIVESVKRRDGGKCCRRVTWIVDPVESVKMKS